MLRQFFLKQFKTKEEAEINDLYRHSELDFIFTNFCVLINIVYFIQSFSHLKSAKFVASIEYSQTSVFERFGSRPNRFSNNEFEFRLRT